MYITPIGNYDKNNNVAFSAKINGITLPKKTADTINKLSSACREVIGRETHLLKTPVGSTNATYSKWSRSFNVDVGDKSSLTVVTDKNKLHSIQATHLDDKSGMVKSFYIYNGCKTAPNPVPCINYAQHYPCEPFSGFDLSFNQGSKISKKEGNLIVNLLSKINEKLGI